MEEGSLAPANKCHPTVANLPMEIMVHGDHKALQELMVDIQAHNMEGPIMLLLVPALIQVTRVLLASSIMVLVPKVVQAGRLILVVRLLTPMVV